jgi:hypothetical protein
MVCVGMGVGMKCPARRGILPTQKGAAHHALLLFPSPV